MMGLAEPEDISPEEARRLAVRSLTSGHFDGRDVNGAMVNALESIAWSLIGVSDTPKSSQARETVREAVEKIGLLRYDDMR